MTTDQRTAAEEMFAALRTLPCTCQRNVPYAGGQVEQFVTKQCARCRSMAAWRVVASESKSGEQS